MRKLLATLLAVGIAACSVDSAPLLASDVIVMKPLPGTHVGAAYLALTNTTDEAVTITKVASPDFEAVTLHETILEDGVSRMVALRELAIPPRQTVALERGGRHLMLMRPVGAIDSVTLQFFADDALLLSVDATVAD